MDYTIKYRPKINKFELNLQGTNISGHTDALIASPSDNPLQVVTDVKEDSQQNMEDEQDNSSYSDAYLS